jgi:predicted membrane metal-binding protein
VEPVHAICTDATAAGSNAPLAAAATAIAPSPARVRAPSATLAPSRAPQAYAPLALGSLLEIAPIYLIAIAILAGDALGVSLFAAPIWLAAMLAIAAAALFMRCASSAATAVAMLAIAAAVSMPARESVAPHYSAQSVRNFPDGAALTLEGRINRASQQYPDREYIFIDVERAGATGSRLQASSGTVRLTVVGTPAPVRVGDEVRVAGALRFARNFGNPGEFDYAGYLARQRIAATMVLNPSSRGRLAVIGYRRQFPASQMAAIRARIGGFIDANLAGEERAEMRALVIGDRGGIGEALRQCFALTGLAHMLVISGLHLGFVAAAAFALVRLTMMLFPALTARGYANKAAALAAALAASAYAAIAMPHVSTARALVMVLAYTLAVISDRARAAGEPGAGGDRDLPDAAWLHRGHRFPAVVRLSPRDRARDAPFRAVVAVAIRSTRPGGAYAPADTARRGGDCGVRRRLVLGAGRRRAADRLSFQPVLGSRRNRQFSSRADHGGRRGDPWVDCVRGRNDRAGARCTAAGCRRMVARGRDVACRMVRAMACRVFQNFHADPARDRDRVRTPAPVAD